MDVRVPQEQQKTIANQHAKAKDPKKQELVAKVLRSAGRT